MRVCFLDTSVLTNILDVPGKNQQRDSVLTEYAQRLSDGWQLILPLTAVLETGNHIAQIRGGHARRTCAQKFGGMLDKVVAGKAPFIIHEMGWDADFLTRLLAGGETESLLTEHLAKGSMGCGDLSILVERERYRARVAGGSVVESEVAPAERDRWLREPVIVEEKLDGANVVLWFDDGGALAVATRSGIGGMDRAGQLGRLRAWGAQHDEQLRTLLAGGGAAYGEWLWLEHSVPYDRLLSYLVVLDLWTHQEGFCPLPERDVRTAAAGLAGPPLLERGVMDDLEHLERLTRRSAFRSIGPAEGVVLRAAGPGTAVCKWVRTDFERLDDEQWRAGRAANRLASMETHEGQPSR